MQSRAFCTGAPGDGRRTEYAGGGGAVERFSVLGVLVLPALVVAGLGGSAGVLPGGSKVNFEMKFDGNAIFGFPVQTRVSLSIARFALGRLRVDTVVEPFTFLAF